MKKSTLKNCLGNTCEYFFGFGSGNYTKTMNFYNQYYEGEKRLIEINSSKIDQVSKIAIRTSLTILESVLIYNSIKYSYLAPLQPIIPSELFRWSSVYFDEKNKKKIRKEKLEATHQSLDEIRDQFDENQGVSKKDKKSDINDADWWKN